MQAEWRTLVNHMLARPRTREIIQTFKAWKQNARLNQNLKNKLQNAINEFNRRPDPYLRFQAELIRLVNANERFRYNKSNRSNGTVTVYYKNSNNGPRSFVNFTRASNNKSAYVSYGYTDPVHRGKGIGTTLRNFGVRAARASGVPMYQYSINLNLLGLVPSKFGKNKKTPISGHIMEKLGAVKIKGIPEGHGRIAKKKHAYMIRAHPYATRFRPK